MIFRARRPVLISSRPTTPLTPSATGDQARPLVASLADSAMFQAATQQGRAVAVCSRRDYVDPMPAPARMTTAVDIHGHPGAGIAVKVSAPFVVPPGALVPRRNVGREVERPGNPGSAQIRGTTAPELPIAGLRLARRASQIEPPGQPGSALSIASRFPPVVYPTPARRVGIAERPGDWTQSPIRSRGGPADPRGHPPRIVSQPERPGHPGAAIKFACPPPPVVYLPTGHRLVIRDLGPIPPAGSALAVKAPTREVPVPVAYPAVRWQPRPLESLAGQVLARRTFAPPEPDPTPAALTAQAGHPRPEGSAKASRSVALASPPGRLVPRVVMVRELEPPGHAGSVRHRKGPHDYTLIVPDPIFLSEAADVFISWWNVPNV